MTSSDLICTDCLHGKHSHHNERWGGICIGCACAYQPLPDAAEGIGETDSHDDPGEVSPASEDHRIVYVEPGASAFIQAVCACGEHLTGSGTTSISTLLAAHIREASPASDAVRDLAAPSSGPGGSRPSPGAAPRVEAIAKVAWEHPGGREFRKHADPFETVSPDVQRMYRKEAGLILAAADAADRAADPPWIRVRADEALAERIENIIRGAMLPVAVEGFTAIETHGPGAARTVLAALREAGEH